MRETDTHTQNEASALFNSQRLVEIAALSQGNPLEKHASLRQINFVTGLAPRVALSQLPR